MPILKSNIVADLGEFGEFDSFSGGGITINVTDYYPAGSQSPLKLLGTGTIGDITVMRGFDPKRDKKLITWGRDALAGKVSLRTLTLRWRSAQGTVIDSLGYTCFPKEVKEPDGKAGDNAVAEISIVLATQSIN